MALVGAFSVIVELRRLIVHGTNTDTRKVMALYLIPFTMPSFLPSAVSSSTPAQIPGANSVVPQNLTSIIVSVHGVIIIIYIVIFILLHCIKSN